MTIRRIGELNPDSQSINLEIEDSISSYLLPGQLLPAISTSTKGGVPSTGTPADKFLMDDGAWTAVDGWDDSRVYKTANESVNNSAVLQNDDHLVLAVVANEICELELTLLVAIGNSTLTNMKFDFTVPTDCSLYFGGSWEYAGAGGADDNLSYVGSVLTIDLNANETKIITVKAIVVNGANAGSIQLQWAQNAAVAVDLVVYKGSCMIKRKLT